MLLQARGVAVALGGMRLLESVDLSVDGGECIAVLGPSGCGKTSLLRALAQLIEPAAGEILLDGEHAHDLPHFRRAVTYVAQRAVMLAGSVRRNLEVPFGFATSGAKTLDLARARALARDMQLPADLLARDARTLSEGQQQRVGLLRALLIEPRVLLLDEPTSALDETTRDAVEAVIRQRVEAGSAAVIVTHESAQIVRLAMRPLALEPHLVRS